MIGAVAGLAGLWEVCDVGASRSITIFAVGLWWAGPKSSALQRSGFELCEKVRGVGGQSWASGTERRGKGEVFAVAGRRVPLLHRLLASAHSGIREPQTLYDVRPIRSPTISLALCFGRSLKNATISLSLVPLFILADKNLCYQQNLAGRRLAILELWTNHRPTLERHFPLIRAAAESIQPGEYRTLESP